MLSLAKRRNVTRGRQSFVVRRRNARRLSHSPRGGGLERRLRCRILNKQSANAPISFGAKAVTKKGMPKVTGSRRNEKLWARRSENSAALPLAKLPRLLLDRRRRHLEGSSEPRKRMAAPIEAMLKKGQKVLLNTRGRHFYAGSNRIARPRFINWKLRLQTVGHITRDRKRASVLWEDNIALFEPLPLMFLEAIEAPT